MKKSVAGKLLNLVTLVFYIILVVAFSIGIGIGLHSIGLPIFLCQCVQVIGMVFGYMYWPTFRKARGE